MALALVPLGIAALAVTIAMSIWVWRRPQRGVLLLAAFTPLNGLLALVPIGALAGWKEGLLLLTAASAFLTGRRRSALNVYAPWWPPMAALLLVGIISALATFGLFGLVALKVTFFYLMIVAILWWAPFDAVDRDHLVSILMGMAALTSVVGIAQQFVGAQALVELGYSYGQQVRSTGGLFRTFSTFNQPFPFALYVMVSLLVGGAVALADPRRRRNMLFLCFSPVMVVAMGTAVVRAAMLGLALGVLWLIVMRFRSGLAVLGIAAVAALGVMVALPSKVLKVVFSSNSLNERNEGWQQIFSAVLQKPFGIGLGGTGAAAERMASASGESTNQIRITATYQPDNYYIKMLLELGPIGLFAITAMLVIALVWTTRAARSLPDPDGAFSLGVSASILAAMAASTVASYFEIFPIDLHFWLLLAVVGCAVVDQRVGAKPAHTMREVGSETTTPTPAPPTESEPAR